MPTFTSPSKEPAPSPPSPPPQATRDNVIAVAARPATSRLEKYGTIGPVQGEEIAAVLTALRNIRSCPGWPCRQRHRNERSRHAEGGFGASRTQHCSTTFNPCLAFEVAPTDLTVPALLPPTTQRGSGLVPFRERSSEGVVVDTETAPRHQGLRRCADS